MADLTLEQEADRLGFRGAASLVEQLAGLFNLKSRSPSSVNPPFWPELEDGDVAELERRIRVVLSSTTGGLHQLHSTHVLRTWAMRHLAGADRGELDRKVREEARAVGAVVDPNDIVHNPPRAR